MPGGGGVLFGVSSALSFGLGDFAGGLAARRSNGLGVAAGAQIVGSVALVAAIAVLAPPLPPGGSLLVAAGSGISGAIGVAALYVALAEGAMGLVASISGVGTVAIPVLFSVFVLGSPIAPLKIVGVGCAAAAVAAAGAASQGRASRRALALALLAAVGFGFWSILLDGAADAGPVWAMTASRIAGASFLLVLSVVRGTTGSIHARPRLVTLSGVCDVGGNALFVASRAVIDVGLAAALAGVYPLVTMLLARIVIREHLPALGLAGVALALIGIVLISVG